MNTDGRLQCIWRKLWSSMFAVVSEIIEGGSACGFEAKNDK